MTRQDQRLADDTTPSEDVVAAYRKAIKDDNSKVSLALVHYRGGRPEFEIGCRYCDSGDPLDRATGADVLAQLGWGNATFQDESVQLLISLLKDPDDHVVYSAAVGLGHRKDVRAIVPLVALSSHINPLVRYGVTHGLLGHADEQAVNTLIQFSRDSDEDIRNWAMFGLGSMTDFDSTTLREALVSGLSDSNMEIRGEALVGLAVRKDPRVVAALLHEWEGDDISQLSLEAAVEIASPLLLAPLRELRATLDMTDDPHFQGLMEKAVNACTGSRD